MAAGFAVEFAGLFLTIWARRALGRAALATGTWLAIVGGVMAGLAYGRKIRLEENLDVAFGAEYDAYRRETWAVVPGAF